MQPRILVTRAPHQASTLADSLRARGLEPILIPTIELAPPTSFAPLDVAISRLKDFHWLIFTSANAVEAFANRINEVVILSGAKDLLCEGAIRVAAVGPATSRSITSLLGIQPSLIPPQALAESLAEALLPHALQQDGTATRFLLIRAEQARDILPESLRAAGADVTIVPAYCNVIPTGSIGTLRALFASSATCPDAIIFTSGSTATNLRALLEEAQIVLPEAILRISIGPITTQTMRDLHMPPHAEAAAPTVEALADAVVQTLRGR